MLVLALALVAAGPPAVAWADPGDVTAAVEDIIAPVENVVAEVESLDGAESESKQGEQVTVALAGDVLFALDKAVLTSQARQRLRRLAERIRSESAGGVVRVDGHTDDQGSDAYNRALSLRRAQAVRQDLQTRLPGVNLQVRGFGESRPKVPNIIEGRPVKQNQARNRRVEIVFTAKQ
ncbi:OmpA family protein [Sphaerisporangium perillae]|uniref:OmpA family protein n=1 Tax=Sphaerisporangium perillae TaxID=2935860 RepID=UPI00200FA1D1|nr:OmpA family protein [Sphaerisporangium perillae]